MTSQSSTDLPLDMQSRSGCRRGKAIARHTITSGIHSRRIACVYFVMVLFLLSACTPADTENPGTHTPAFTRIPSTSTAEKTMPQALTTATKTITPTIGQPTQITPGATDTPLPSSVEAMPNPDDFIWQPIMEGLDQPVGLASAMDGSQRLYVIEQKGLIRVMQDAELLSQPFIDLRERVSTKGSTVAGLLGLAFHPRYAMNGYFFVHYTQEGGDSVIARYESTLNRQEGLASSELRLLKISFPIGEHKGGHLEFGPDGFLYISVGDGGASGYGDQEGNAQNPGSWLGKILRIDVDSAEPYAIPDDNPFFTSDGLPEVWAYGLRNPWRFTFDRLTGELYIADVGENRWEEVNFIPAHAPGGSNFGWSYLEGTDTYKGQPPESLKLVNPVIQYDHTQGCSVTGGVVYRGTALPEWNGIYLYGDFCQGNVWGLLKRGNSNWENELLYKIPSFITSFGQDEEGEVYLVDLTGKIYKLVRKP